MLVRLLTVKIHNDRTWSDKLQAACDRLQVANRKPKPVT